MGQAQKSGDLHHELVDLQQMAGERDRLMTERELLIEDLASLRGILHTLTDECGQAISDFRNLRAASPSAAGRDTMLSVVAGKSLPVYLTDDFQPVVNPRSGATPERILICSIPKAGTYLYTRLLELLGVERTGLHLSVTHFNDYRFRTIEEGRNDHQRLRVEIPVEKAVNLVRPGQFAVSHLERSRETIDVLRGFKILFLYREMRAAAVSHMRWVASTSWGMSETDGWRDMPDGPEKMLRYLDEFGTLFFDGRCHPVLGWHGRPDVLSLSFEQICGDFGADRQAETVHQICTFCGIKSPPSDIGDIVQKLIGQKTNTWSGSRSRHQDHWNNEVERRFVDLGGPDLNRRLGYGD